MPIQNVTVTFRATKVGGGDVQWKPNASTTLTTITATGATKSVAEAAIAQTIADSIAFAQGNVQDLQDGSAAFNS
jgi:hypothetical protein